MRLVYVFCAAFILILLILTGNALGKETNACDAYIAGNSETRSIASRNNGNLNKEHASRLMVLVNSCGKLTELPVVKWEVIAVCIDKYTPQACVDLISALNRD